MKKMKSFFTLIELITVIVVIGILAAIVVPNVKDMKKESITSMLHSNIRNIQTASDAYFMKNNEYPTFIQPTLENPQLVDLEKLFPKYIKSEPEYAELKNQYYWVDYYGKVWGSSVKSPSNIFEGTDSIEFTSDKNAVAYNLYSIVDNKVTGKAEVEKIKLAGKYLIQENVDRVKLEKPDSQFLVSSVDQFDLESAPVGLGQDSTMDGFTPLRNKQGEFVYEITSKELMYWEKFYVVEDKPVGTSIEYTFSIQNDKGIYQGFVSDFKSLPASTGIQVKVKMTGSDGKLPSLLDMNVEYHFAGTKAEEFTLVSSKNLVNNKPADMSLPIEIVEHFTLPAGEKLKEIIINDYYALPAKVEYYYQPQGKTTYTVIGSFADVPAGSTIRVVKTYPAQEDFYMFPTKVEFKPTVESVKLEKVTTTTDAPAPEPVIEWETVQRLNFFAQTTDAQITDWLSMTATDNQPEGTRIVYTFTSGNDGIWGTEVENFDDAVNSKSLRVSAYLQVQKELVDKVTDPSISKIVITHARGDINLTQGLEGNIFPELSDFKASGSYGGAVAQYVGDGNIGTMWNAGSNTGWVQYTFKTPTKFKGIQIVNEATPSTGQAFTIKGMKNGQWIDLGTQNVYTSQRPHIHAPMYVTEDTYEALYIYVNGGSSWAAIREILLIQ